MERQTVEVIGENKLHKFAVKQPNSRTPIKNWLSTVEQAKWTTLVELQQTYASADYVKGFVIFNLGGNNFRLVTVVEFSAGRIFIGEVMTHAQYDRWEA
jgi:mRNA interferase HigB